MKSFPLLLFFFGIAFLACNRKLAVNSSASDPAGLSENDIIHKVYDQSVKAKWVQAKGQVALDGGGFLSSGSLTLRVCRDSLVWFSVTKLGIEISRGIIRADSAFVLDVWNKEYWSGSLMEISQKYNVPAQFSDMQAVLFPTLDPMATYMFSKQADGYHLSQPGLLAKQFQISDPDMQIQSITVSQHDADLKVMYSDYKKVEDFVFPFTHIHTIKQSNNFHESKIKFSSIQTAPIYNTPFNISDDYTLMK